uniref:Retrotransposon gag domain-containing protein n=1 Tax=Biomphalaria glabrata TaxID=6526 RepID=A0A2C9KY02_BIOGL
MDKLLRPKELDIDPNAPLASEKWTHWYDTFQNFLSSIKDINEDFKLKLLKNHVSATVYMLISDVSSYSMAIDTLKTTYIKVKNDIFARHLVATCKQQPSQTVESFMLKFRSLARDFDFKEVTSEQHRDICIRDAFITGLASNTIRQRLLEKTSLTLQSAFDEARVLETATTHAQAYNSMNEISCGAMKTPTNSHLETYISNEDQELNAIKSLCYFCGRRSDTLGLNALLEMHYVISAVKRDTSKLFVNQVKQQPPKLPAQYH